jgi:anthranilate synthase/aminodeoxychorismate synthase-like glutamine amidotransferase
VIFLLDNYDSFTFNLYQYLGELGAEVRVERNDALSVEEILALSPEAVVISPGPGRPVDAGVSLDLLRQPQKPPILGVCLGHQAIGEAFGGDVVRAHPMHGKTSEIHHDGRTIFEGLPNPFVATRYHSLVVERQTLPPVLEVSAWTEDGTIMGLRHKELPIEGVQFHPESFLTSVGKDLLQRFLSLVRARAR